MQFGYTSVFKCIDAFIREKPRKNCANVSHQFSLEDELIILLLFKVLLLFFPDFLHWPRTFIIGKKTKLVYSLHSEAGKYTEPPSSILGRWGARVVARHSWDSPHAVVRTHPAQP